MTKVTRQIRVSEKSKIFKNKKILEIGTSSHRKIEFTDSFLKTLYIILKTNTGRS